MTVENMREAITGQYITSMWAAKVKKMPDEQVIAIYFRMAQDGQFEKKQVALSYSDTAMPHSSVFYCRVCLKVFKSDNKNETECRFCGSSDITKNAPKERIRKNED